MAAIVRGLDHGIGPEGVAVFGTRREVVKTRHQIDLDRPQRAQFLRRQPEFTQFAGVAGGTAKPDGFRLLGRTVPSYGRRGPRAYFDRLLLQVDQMRDAAARQREQPRHLRIVEGAVFGGSLHFDKPAGRGHHHVHIDVGLGIFFVAEVQHRLSAHQPHAGGGHVFAHGHGFQHAVGYQLPQRQRKRDKRAGDGRRARAAIGLQYVAIQNHGALAERDGIHHRAQRAADEPLNFMSPAGRPALVHLARRALGGGPRQHGVFRRHPALAGVAQEGRHRVLHAGGAQHLRVAHGDQA